MPVSSKTLELEYRGRRYGSWLVLGDMYRAGKHRKCLCRCACGVEKYVDVDHLRSGRSTRCKRCHNKEAATRPKPPQSDVGRKFQHIPSDVLWRLRRIVKHTTRRCTNKMDLKYHDYGERGIEVKFIDAVAFIDHLITLPGYDDPSLVVDRVDNDGHYEVGNLRFTTYSESNYNRRKPCKKHPSTF